MRVCLVALPVLFMGFFMADAHAGVAPTLPSEVDKALHSATQVELYSLEPWFDDDSKEQKWHELVLLGHVTLKAAQAKSAVAQVDAALKGGAGKSAACVEPRQALRVESAGHHYDLLLSYDCHSLVVYVDDRKVATIAAAGSPEVLNKLLKQPKLPLSQSASD